MSLFDTQKSIVIQTMHPWSDELLDVVLDVEIAVILYFAKQLEVDITMLRVSQRGAERESVHQVVTNDLGHAFLPLDHYEFEVELDSKFDKVENVLLIPACPFFMKNYLKTLEYLDCFDSNNESSLALVHLDCSDVVNHHLVPPLFEFVPSLLVLEDLLHALCMLFFLELSGLDAVSFFDDASKDTLDLRHLVVVAVLSGFQWDDGGQALVALFEA